jgi:hypothetical protein
VGTDRFDALIRLLTDRASRRAAVGSSAAAMLSFLGFVEASSKKREKRCNKKCGPCKTCKKGKCRPKPDGTDCGNCRSCQGGACLSDCDSDQECRDGQCTCGGTACAGCCDGTTCRHGDTLAFCGRNGRTCVECVSGQECFSGECVCAYSSCTGCCSGTTCQPGTNEAACGQYANACVTCQACEVCSDGICVNDCAGGHVCRNGTCVCPSGQKECHGTCIDISQCCGICPQDQVCCYNVGECTDIANDPSACGQCVNGHCPGEAICANGDCALTCSTVGQPCLTGCICATRVDPSHSGQKICARLYPFTCDNVSNCNTDLECGFGRVCVSDLCFDVQGNRTVCADPCA